MIHLRKLEKPFYTLKEGAQRKHFAICYFDEPRSCYYLAVSKKNSALWYTGKYESGRYASRDNSKLFCPKLDISS